MLGDDNQDKQMARNQLIALALMSVLFLVWIQYFSPAPPVQQPSDSQEITETVAVVPADPVDSILGPVSAPAVEPAEPAATPVAEVDEADFAAEEVVILEGDQLRLAFTTWGARLKGAEVLLGDDHGGVEEQLVPPVLEGTTPDKAVYPLGVLFSDPEVLNRFDKTVFTVAEQSERHVVFEASLSGVGTLRKTYRLADDRAHVVTAEVALSYAGGETRRFGVDDTPAYVVSWAPDVTSHDADKLVRPALVWRSGGNTEFVLAHKLKPDDDGRPADRVVTNIEWMGRRSAYYVVAFRPMDETAQGRYAGLEERYAFGLGRMAYLAQPGETSSFAYELYIGPNTQVDLAAAWETLPTALRFFSYPNLMDRFAKFLLRCMNWLHNNVFNSYGVAIILLTLCVRLLMFPLTIKQVRSMKRLQTLAPEMERIKNEFGDDPAKQQAEMMKLWRENNANPLGGCLPLLFQMPVFIALYRMLSSAYELRGAPFLYIEDLSQADRLFHMPFLADLPLIGSYFEYFNLIPLLGAVAMVLSIKLSPQGAMSINPQQKMMMTIMPVAISLMFYTWPSGLNLYVLTSTLMGIAQTHLMRLLDDKEVKPETVKKRPQRKRQHWYAAAVAKKKQLEKEQSKGNGAKKGAKAKAGAQRNRKGK